MMSCTSGKELDRLGIPNGKRGLYLRLDGAKANAALVTTHATWFKRESIVIPNGDEVRVLTHANLSDFEPIYRTLNQSIGL